MESVPRVSTKRVDPRKASQSTKRVRRTAAVVTSTDDSEIRTRQVKTTKVAKSTKKVKKTASPSVSESNDWNVLFQDEDKDAYSSSLENTKSMISSGSEDREILRRLQRGDGWSADQSKYILETARL